ncbi:MAG: CPBP family intramembrane metalloprotease [Bacteroides sp.]|nr:CPBP family intramembrane metalloprotease [Bacteroides sp.]MCM1413147.1 CPBP family intramembrane metalloprotease [Bacteroides sp.]MCM1472111.1 CPBP family intramembrane metalloprotease [Bacteroides sp.]
MIKLSVNEPKGGDAVVNSFTVSIGQRYLMVVCTWVLCFLIASVAGYFITGHGLSAPKVRIALVVQDILMFVFPAIISAVVINRRPVDFLMLKGECGPLPYLYTFALLVSMVPAMNAVIAWNTHLTLPESMAGVQQWMESSETSAAEVMNYVTGGTSVGGLILSILIVGVLAGFSEELFFRGVIQRVMITSQVNAHVAIWLTAIIFSAVHMQFFGFVPRMLLGALFGYLAYWGRSIWLPMFAHALNNSLAVYAMWVRNRNGADAIDIDKIGTGAGSDWILVAGSLALSAYWIYAIWRQTRSKNVQ